MSTTASENKGGLGLALGQGEDQDRLGYQGHKPQSLKRRTVLIVDDDAESVAPSRTEWDFEALDRGDGVDSKDGTGSQDLRVGAGALVPDGDFSVECPGRRHQAEPARNQTPGTRNFQFGAPREMTNVGDLQLCALALVLGQQSSGFQGEFRVEIALIQTLQGQSQPTGISVGDGETVLLCPGVGQAEEGTLLKQSGPFALPVD